MKICHINHTDNYTGGARAAYRIHRSLLKQGVESRMLVNQSSTGDWSVQLPGRSAVSKLFNKVRPLVAEVPHRFFTSSFPVPHSASYVKSDWPSWINSSGYEVVNLHWVYEMMSIEDIARIRKPLVWTMHDMWAFCGAEHYTEDLRWQTGYLDGNRPDYESGFDLNRWVWRRKAKAWKCPIHMVTPSRWLKRGVQESRLMEGWPVTVIPNPIDTTFWKPVDRAMARSLFGIAPDIPLLLFGANGGGRIPNKGYDLLLSALGILRSEMPELELMVFGQRAPEKPEGLGFPVHYIGHLHDDMSLRLLYSAADAMVVPSRIEAFGQTASEAHACGIPVIAFDTTGLPDIVDHQETGYLARRFETGDLARGVRWVLEDRENRLRLQRNAREKAVRNFDYTVVSSQYLEVYERVLHEGHNRTSTVD